jgi:hypothetical protein
VQKDLRRRGLLGEPWVPLVSASRPGKLASGGDSLSP